MSDTGVRIPENSQRKSVHSTLKLENMSARETYLWELGDKVVGYFHGVVDEVKYLCQLPFIGGQKFGHSKNYVLDLVSLKAKLYFTHL